jgi:peptidoglycan hydrolase-like protein with peptidoglycan-binding domain
VSSASQKLTADEGQATSARTNVTGAKENLSTAQTSEVVYDQGAVYTMLPPAGAVIRRGHALFAIDTKPTLLLYGPVVAWRAFRLGMTPGRDVSELNRNLDVLGYGHDLAGEHFTAATAKAVAALQAAHGLAQTGILRLGAVLFRSSEVRVTGTGPTLGQAVQPGPVLHISSTRHHVVIQLDSARQSQVDIGERVDVTLPDNSTTPGVVSKVGKVATASSGDQGGGGSGTPTIEVYVRLTRQDAAGSLDQAPVSVSIITGTVSNALVVPVNALLALAGGGYAVEIAGAGGIHHLVAVTPGLFDDADGLVQVTGSGLRPGQRVVVPGS